MYATAEGAVGGLRRSLEDAVDVLHDEPDGAGHLAQLTGRAVRALVEFDRALSVARSHQADGRGGHGGET
jgi:hypothetical protein